MNIKQIKVIKFLSDVVKYKCVKCRHEHRYDFLNFFLSYLQYYDQFARCKKCKRSLKRQINNLVKEIAYATYYQTLFVKGIYMALDGDQRGAVIEAFTSLEIFLSIIAEYRLYKRGTSEIVADYILNNMGLNIRNYRELLTKLRLDVNEDQFNKLRSAQDIRNRVVHHGYWPRDKEVEDVLMKIGRIFNNLERYYPA